MKLDRALELAKTVPTPAYGIGDTVQTEDGPGIIVGIHADPYEPGPSIEYDVQVIDDPASLDEWDGFDPEVADTYEAGQLKLIQKQTPKTA